MGQGTQTLAQRLSQSLRDPLRAKDFLGQVAKGDVLIDCHHHSKVLSFKNRKAILSDDAMANLIDVIQLSDTNWRRPHPSLPSPVHPTPPRSAVLRRAPPRRAPPRAADAPRRPGQVREVLGAQGRRRQLLRRLRPALPRSQPGAPPGRAHTRPRPRGARAPAAARRSLATLTATPECRRSRGARSPCKSSSSASRSRIV